MTGDSGMPDRNLGLRVAIADDVVLIRAGLIRLLGAAGITVVAEVGDVARLVQAVGRERPDAVIVDIRMPPSYTDEGIVAVEIIRSRYPGTAVLILSQYLAIGYAERLLAEGPSGMGYLLKERVTDPAVLVDALERITRGESVVDQDIVRRLIERSHRRALLSDLTPRERDVLAQIAQGWSNVAIAGHLGINERTVESVSAQVFRKLNLQPDPRSNRRVLAVLEALRR